MKEKVTFRVTKKEERPIVLDYLSDSEVLQWFPMTNRVEIEDAVNIMLSYIPQKACFTALYDETVCGFANFYLSPYARLAHQALFAIILQKELRGRGIGTAFLMFLFEQARHLHLKILHLEVYEGNPAISLYRRLGFVQYGVHPHFLRDQQGKRGNKILMEKYL